MTSKERFFSDYYDSVHQRAFGEDDAKRFIGRLRFDILHSQTLVTIDTQILDGALFLKSDPDVLIKSLARYDDAPNPIEIRARTSDLEQSLVAFLKKKNQNKLSGFSFSVIRDKDQRSKVAQLLQDIPASEVDNFSDVRKLFNNQMLRGVVEQDNLEMMFQGWERWIKAAKQGAFKGAVVPWDAQIGDTGIIPDIKRIFPRTSPMTDHVKSIIDCILLGKSRSSIDLTINDFLEKHMGKFHLYVSKGMSIDLNEWEHELRDVIRIQEVYDRGYNEAIARQHGCALNFESRNTNLVEQLRDKPNSDAPIYEDSCAITASFLDYLSDLNGNDFKILVRPQRRHLERFWADGEYHDLADAIGPIAKEAGNQQIPNTGNSAIGVLCHGFNWLHSFLAALDFYLQSKGTPTNILQDVGRVKALFTPIVDFTINKSLIIIRNRRNKKVEEFSDSTIQRMLKIGESSHDIREPGRKDRNA